MLGHSWYVYDLTPGDEGYDYGPDQITDLCADASEHQWLSDSPHRLPGFHRWLDRSAMMVAATEPMEVHSLFR